MLDKKLSVILNRVPVLDNPDNINKTFKLTDGKIQIKKADSRLYDNIKYIFVIICLVLLPLIYIAVPRFPARLIVDQSRVSRTFSLLRNRFCDIDELITTKAYRIWDGLVLYKTILGNTMNDDKKKPKPCNTKKRKNVCYDDIRDFIASHYSMLKEREIAADSGSISFIEEQCRMHKNLPKFADMYQSSLNSSSQNNDVELLSDYASFIKGARVLSTSKVEPYVQYKILVSLLDTIFGIKYLTVDDLLVCRFIPSLCKYFVSGPSSILQPWKEPGECWSFKGTRGRVQIELSDRIHLTAITLEHIRSPLASLANIYSAPRTFSVIGIDDADGYRFTSRIDLGTYEYQLSDYNLQTFYFSKDDSILTFKIIEINIESNHGNENYTCIYRFRVHGHP